MLHSSSRAFTWNVTMWRRNRWAAHDSRECVSQEFLDAPDDEEDEEKTDDEKRADAVEWHKHNFEK